jgi:hypothetical protein
MEGHTVEHLAAAGTEVPTAPTEGNATRGIALDYSSECWRRLLEVNTQIAEIKAPIQAAKRAYKSLKQESAKTLLQLEAQWQDLDRRQTLIQRVKGLDFSAAASFYFLFTEYGDVSRLKDAAAAVGSHLRTETSEHILEIEVYSKARVHYMSDVKDVGWDALTGDEETRFRPDSEAAIEPCDCVNFDEVSDLTLDELEEGAIEIDGGNDGAWAHTWLYADAYVVKVTSVRPVQVMPRPRC